MYDVIFKIVVEPFTKLKETDKSRKHVFVNYMKKHLVGYQMYKYNFERISDDFLYIVKDGILLNDENDIEEYNKLVDKFKLFANEEYNKISKYCVNANITAYMGVYNKDAYEKNEEVDWSIQTYLRENNIMPNYDTILQQYCEVKTYDAKNKTIKSEFTSYQKIKYSIKCRLDYDTFFKKLIELPINYIRSMFKDEFCNGLSIIFFGREEMVNGYTPKYKLGDIVEYQDKISIIRHAPEPVEHYGNKIMSTRYGLDFITEDGYYCWTDGEFVTNDDLKPYTGEVPEFMKLLQKAVLEQEGFYLDLDSNVPDVDYLLSSYNVITEFDKFKDRLIEILKKHHSSK